MLRFGPIVFSAEGGAYVTLGRVDRWTVLDRTDNLGDALGRANLASEQLGHCNVAVLTVHPAGPEGWLPGLIPVPAEAVSRQPLTDAKSSLPDDGPVRG